MSKFVEGQMVKLIGTHPGDGGWSTAYVERIAGSSYGVRVQFGSFPFYWVNADSLALLED